MTVQSLQLQSLRSNFLLPIVYQLTLDAALKFHGKSDSSLKLEDPVTKTAFLSKINRMTNLFSNVHALIKKRHPFTDFIWMCELDEIKGVGIGET
jgi:hypothetical protein